MPTVKCENRSRTTCSRFHRLHSESTLACGGGLWGNTCGTCRPQPPSHTLSKEKKTHSLSKSLQRSAPGSVVPEHPRSAQFVHVHPCCRLTPVRALRTTSPTQSATGSVASDRTLDHLNSLLRCTRRTCLRQQHSVKYRLNSSESIKADTERQDPRKLESPDKQNFSRQEPRS